MPHVEIKYSNDVEFSVNGLFEAIETTINELDSSAGVCKSRAYPAVNYKHTHIMIDIWLLPKPHRDQAFNQLLLEELQKVIRNQISENCYVSLQLYYRDTNYRTIE